jgi:hypothetical protein
MKTKRVNSQQPAVSSQQNTDYSKKLLTMLFVLAIAFQFSVSSLDCFAQLSISPTPKTPDNSAMLDISSSTRGLLINRMNTVQRDAITPDANAMSLLIFNTDTKCFEAYVNGGWFAVSCPGGCTPPSAPVSAAASNIGCTSFTANWNASSGALSYYLDVSTNSGFSNFINSYNNLYVGNSTSFSVIGLSKNIQYWYRVRAASGCLSENSTSRSVMTIDIPVAPTAGSNTLSLTQIIWRWNTVSGATGYQWSTSGNTYPGVGVNTVTGPSYTQGISCGNNYTLYVWSYNACGNSTSYATLTQATTPCGVCNATNTITNINGKTIYTFNTSGTFTPNFTGNVSVLVVAGGGGGGNAGGGAGGVVYNATIPVLNGTSYPVTVGLGGAGGRTNTAENGQNSVFSTITAIGGGGGGATGCGLVDCWYGRAGGSGGGSFGFNGGFPLGATPYPGGNGTPGQGNKGGSSLGVNGTPYWPGGGGGAGAPGGDAIGSIGGSGGNGIANPIPDAIPAYVGGGGGGGIYTCCNPSIWFGAPGGIGGGGGGGSQTGPTDGFSGAPNTGGGGGGQGAWSQTGGRGGCGVVIISY